MANKDHLSPRQQVIILASGITGAMAYTFSDSFWFSAVEAEVYALSSLCTAVVFWAILKWDAEADDPRSARWLLFIAYVIGLSIGIHLLSLLAIPAIALVFYLRKNKTYTVKGIALSLFTGCLILGFVQYGVIQYLVLFASRFELFFVNGLGLPFGSGAISFAVLLITGIIAGLIYSHQRRKATLNLILLCATFVIFGYSSYAMLMIRANAKTSINVSNPDNTFSMLGYLSREQYGDTPLLYGPYFDSQVVASEETGKLYRKGKDRYEVAGTKESQEYDRNTIFPRLYSTRAEHLQAYKSWLNLAENQHPTFADNLRFFFSYQTGFMYMRYFLWNFAGRQNDIQGFGERMRGNWITGIKPLDALHLGDQSHLPKSIVANGGYNRFYGLPLLIGLIGLFFHLRRRPGDAGVTALLFFFTGMAIILYLNQGPQEVRERDYAYAGSFYAFAIWIGLGVPGLIQLIRRFTGEKISIPLSVMTAILCAPVIMALQGWDDHDRSGNYIARDMAANCLESCAPNAILFTNADNDTYPLWYAQEVEGIRPDVRIVNLQLAYNDSYLDQLKEKIRSSAPLPLSMSKDKYVKGVRDYMPFADYGITDSVELKDIFELLTSDNDNDKVQMQDGSRLNFLPTRKFKLTVDKAQLVKTGTVKPRELDRVASKMEWSIEGNFITRADLALIDILSHNNWQRPIYFSASLPRDSYFGLDRYLSLEGYAYRLLPFERAAEDTRDKSEITNSSTMYANVMSRFQLDSFKKASYLDPEAKRVARNTWEAMNTLTSNLLNEGDPERARAVMTKTLTCLPAENSELIDTANKVQTVFNLYQLKEKKTAKALTLQAAAFIDAELNYYVNLPAEEQHANMGLIRYAFAILESYRKAAVENGEIDLDKKIRKIYSSVEAKII